MDVRGLRYLLALVREKHFSRAADACNISQPTLSGHVRRLEEEFGISIINRGNRYQGLTPEGERIVEWAKKIVNHSDCLLDEVAALRSDLRGLLNIGVIPSALPVMPLLTIPLQQKYQGLILNIISQTSIDIQRDLESQKIHAGVTYLNNEPLQKVRCLPLYSEEYAFLVAEDDANFSDTDEITWREASCKRLCLLNPDMQNRRIINAVFNSIGEEPVPVMETNSIVALYTHVRMCDMYSIVPRNHFFMLGVPDGLKLITLCEPVARQKVGIICPDIEPISPRVEAFWQVGELANIHEKLLQPPIRAPQLVTMAKESM